MAIEVTEEAVEVLSRSLELGGVGAGGGIRLRAARGLGGGMDVQVELADGPGDKETTLETRGLRLFIDEEVSTTYPDAVVAVEPQHETIVLRPAESGSR